MDNIRKGTLLVLRDFSVFTFPDIFGGKNHIPTPKNIMVIVEEDPDENGIFLFKADQSVETPIWIPSIESETDVFVLAQDADPEKDVHDECMRLLPNVIVSLAVASRPELAEVATVESVL